MVKFITGASLAERIRDWDWDLMDPVIYIWGLIHYHIDRLGWIGWILVPLSVWLTLLFFRPTRYIASLLGIDIYRNTLSNFISGTFRFSETVVVNTLGIFVARLRGTARFVINWFRS